jgi:hypothetical protein
MIRSWLFRVAPVRPPGRFIGQNVPSVARVAAGASGFLTLIQVLVSAVRQKLPSMHLKGCTTARETQHKH